jgi:hypothetical protein
MFAALLALTAVAFVGLLAAVTEQEHRVRMREREERRLLNAYEHWTDASPRSLR